AACAATAVDSGPTALRPSSPAALRSPFRIATRRDVPMAPPLVLSGSTVIARPGAEQAGNGCLGDIPVNSASGPPGRVPTMNRLADETSPYLRQHKDNPVDWYPWGDEAFARARAEDKPVLLSVGYSACHWCHVMAHESFEDPATAEVMNRLFVNVKVDREERPHVDSIYMEAVQALTGHGGWPMTVFLTPEGKPFYGGTYFPKDDRHGLPGFTRLLEAVDDAWRERRDELLGQAGRLATALAGSSSLPGAGDG